MKKIKLLLLFCLVAIAASASKTVYLAPGPWNADGARYALYMYDDTQNPKIEDWTDFTEDNGVWSAEFDETYKNMIICRMNGSTAENNWDNKWNQTANLDAPIIDGLTYTVTKTGNDLVINDGLTVAGNFYLYNVGQGKYLTSGNWWGTHAALDSDGMLITVTAADGGYTLSTNVAFSGKYVNPNGYVDSDQAVWSFTVAEDNKYVLKSNNKYLVSTNSVVADVSDSEPTTSAGYWQLVTREQLIENLSNATKANPIEASFYMTNPKIRRNWPVSFSGESFSDKGSFNASAEGLYNGGCGSVGQYRKTFDNYQALTNVVNGKYKVTVKGFNREGSGYSNAYLYANNEKQQLKTKGDIGTDNADNATRALVDDTYLVDAVEVTVTDGNLRVGVKSDGNVDWSTWREFTLMYLGKAVTNEALVLPNDGNIVAGQWYKFVVPVDGNYTITAGTAANIIQTTNGNQLVEDATGDIITTGDEVALSEGTYFFKSFSDNTLTIEVKSYVYSVSEATSDIAYIQSGNTVTISYTVATNSGAALSQDYSGVTFNGNAISVTPTASGFTFTVPEELTTATDYTLAIPAGAIGYAAGSTYNAAQNITLTTPAIFDGVYYMYNTYTESYISRAGNYNTQAVLDNCGLAFNVSTDSENNTKLQYFDSQYWLGDDGWCYGDCTGNRVRTFNITKVTGGYKFLNTNNSKYLAANSNAVVADAVEGGNLIGTSNVWALESTEAHKANYTVNANTQAASAASDITLLDELGTITNKATLDTELASNYTATPIDITGSKAEKYQVYPGNGKDDGPVTYYSETVYLEPGLYKLSVDAFQREAGYDRVAGADGARGIIYLYAGDAKTQLKSVMDYGANDAYTQKANDWETPNFESGGKNYPNCEASAYAALETGNYTNDVYFYVASTGDVEIGIKNPSRLGGNFSTWCVYNNWTLTRYEKTPFTASFVNGEGWEHVYAYVWNGDGSTAEQRLEGDWPGTELDTKSGTATYNGEDFDVFTYSYTSNDMPEKIIFNNGKAGDDPEKEQTADLTFTNGMTDISKVTLVPVYAIVGSNADESDKLFFPANFSEATTTTTFMAYDEGTSKWTATFASQEIEAQTLKFKVIKRPYRESTDVTWYPGGDNETITVSEDGIYNLVITFDGTNDPTYTLTDTQEKFTVTAAGWATAKTTNAVDFTGVEGLKAYIATLSGNTVTLTEATEVPGNTPIVLKGVTKKVNIIESAAKIENNALTWYDNYTVNDSYAYIYALKADGEGKAKFARVQNGLTFSNKAVIEIVGASGARELDIVFAGEIITGITNVKAAKEDALYYNLNGQRVNAPAKGLYIVNGKKVIKK